MRSFVLAAAVAGVAGHGGPGMGDRRWRETIRSGIAPEGGRPTFQTKQLLGEGRQTGSDACRVRLLLPYPAKMSRAFCGGICRRTESCGLGGLSGQEASQESRRDRLPEQEPTSSLGRSFSSLTDVIPASPRYRTFVLFRPDPRLHPTSQRTRPMLATVHVRGREPRRTKVTSGLHLGLGDISN